MEKHALYSSLPPEINKISQQLGLEKGVGDLMQQYVHERLPKKESIEDFRYKQYNLYEIIETRKPDWKKPGTKKLNYKQKKALFDIRKEKFRYSDFAKLNELWQSYFDSILAETKANGDQLKLSRADFHGALFEVIASKNTTSIGAKGFVLQESKQTFRILTQDNRTLTIPKNGTVFGLEHKGKLYKLNGYNILMSSYNRSKVKPKYNYILDL